MEDTISALGPPQRSEAECRATIGLRPEDIPVALWSDRLGIGTAYAATYTCAVTYGSQSRAELETCAFFRKIFGWTDLLAYLCGGIGSRVPVLSKE